MQAWALRSIISEVAVVLHQWKRLLQDLIRWKWIVKQQRSWAWTGNEYRILHRKYSVSSELIEAKEEIARLRNQVKK